MYFYPDCGMEGEVPKDGNITKQLVSNTNGTALRSHFIVSTTTPLLATQLPYGGKFREDQIFAIFATYDQNAKKFEHVDI